MPAIERPVVSIIMINLNNGHALAQAIQSILSQDYERFELIVVDAGSSDDSISIIGQLDTLRPVRTYYHQDASNPLPINAARQRGLGLATGDIVCFVDSDCLYPPAWIATIVEDIELSNVAAVFGPRLPDRGKGLGTLIRRLEGYRSRKFRAEKAVTLSKHTWPIFYFAGCNLAIRHDVLETIPLFDPRFMHSSFEDVDLQMRILEAGYAVHFNPRLLIQHIHPLGALDLLRKSHRSGVGLAHLMVKYPRMALAKWSPVYDLLFWTLLWCMVAICPISVCQCASALVFVLMLDGLRRLWSRALLHESATPLLVAIPLKVLRDALCMIGFLLTLGQIAVAGATIPLLSRTRPQHLVPRELRGPYRVLDDGQAHG